MVEFDDGDRGRISLASIRLLPPGYQIHCEYPSKANNKINKKWKNKTTKNKCIKTTEAESVINQ